MNCCVRVKLESRDSRRSQAGLTLGIGCETAQFPLPKVGKDLFRDLKRVAQTLDSIDGERSIRRSVMNWLSVLTILN